MLSKIVAICLFVVTARAIPTPYGYVPEPVEKPQPYDFSYEVRNDYGDTQWQQESGDEYGNKQGSYGYRDAAGVYRQVEYIADQAGARFVIKTNEPGTDNQNPADVQITSEKAPATYQPKVYSVPKPNVYRPVLKIAPPAYVPSVLVACLFVVVANAVPTPYGYAPEPVEAPQPYDFSYDIKNDYGDTQWQQESGDASGNKQGSYGYRDAAGVYRQVEYVADANGVRFVIKTNEPGTDNQNPADVQITSEQAPATYQPKVYAAPKPAAYHPVVKVAAPAYVSAAKETPKPYEFAFEVKDDEGNTITRKESGDGSGAVTGSYGYIDATGQYRQVTYLADPTGFHPQIKSNEPGLGDAAPADVQIVLEPPPAVAPPPPPPPPPPPKKHVKYIHIPVPQYGYH
ncbi:actin cytoskeleton-regulatory complex protein PAN1-like [Limulus polyphemus]|uniref:Actin cytoskeleton-regulatory complex protein PAN1-like n=1 Tax=Limulus polyphemus TaxID=6850 RepID=A0ABM1BE78_LIMPO|nr:actin cytoskeleton-regulatory complex protein PAN1-like [Limulus polyphemus]